MANFFLVVMSFLLTSISFGQSDLSINNVLSLINSKEYRINIIKDAKKYDLYKNGIIMLETGADYSVYYVVDDRIIALNDSSGIECGFSLIIYSSTASKGILLSFSRSHKAIHRKNNDYVINFSVYESLLILQKELISESLDRAGQIKISYLEDNIPPDDEPFSIVTFMFNVGNEKNNEFSFYGNYADMKFDSLIKLIQDHIEW